MSLLEHFNVSIIHRDYDTFHRLLRLFSGEQLNEGFYVENNNNNTNGFRPLHFACHINNYEAVNQLMKIKNIDLNIPDEKGDTPFMVAIWKSSVECVELMTSNKNVDIFTWVGDWTFERRRTERDKEKITAYLRKKRTERIQSGTVPLLHQLIEYIECKDDLNFTRVLKDMTGHQVNQGDHNGNKPIHVAVVSNNKKALEKILKVENIDPNDEDNSGFTAFTKAFILSRAECMDILLKDMRVNIYQPILPAVIEGSKADRVKVGMTLSEETNRRIGLGEATLVQQFNHAIECHDNSEVCKILKKMNIKEINEAEPGLLYTPLHVACRMDMPKAVEELLKIDGIDLSAKTRYGRTAFMLAIRCCSVESLKVIMEDSRFHLDSLESVEKIIGTVNNRYGMMCKENEINKIRELIKKFIEKKKKIESKPKDTKKDDQQETKIKEIHDNVKKNEDYINLSKLKNEYEQTKKSDAQEEKLKKIHGNAENKEGNIDVSIMPDMNFSTLCWRCSSTQVKLYKCGGCLKARYCSKPCITNDWHEHMNYCLKVQKKRSKKQNVSKNNSVL